MLMLDLVDCKIMEILGKITILSNFIIPTYLQEYDLPQNVFQSLSEHLRDKSDNSFIFLLKTI